ncbi:MAG: redox-regulated ATPase YchF [Bacteroidota bacterium]|nr:redox-regulated ATPase YchF [Bacteroidota bacterium]MDP4234211.1 redox-regulated ATPase YchF [Bacteroidota bacterium]MDP4244129.1 redox-regulated ATPase YchF [Bacteroidota bacterium]MDP4288100.1 redox-regulated ATPase YchF [Bacteroidota bacterium]
MGIRCGIVGLPNVGKSTLFNAITASSQAAAENYPFCTIEPNTGIVPVPDTRIHELTEIVNPAREVPATIEFVDIAGLVKGAAQGEGLGNQFLSHIREVDAIAHVVRCFDDPNVIHVDADINPRRDIEVVETELILKDLETLDKKSDAAQRKGKTGDPKARAEADFYERLREHLAKGRLARYFPIANDDEKEWMRDTYLLTSKPVLYVANTDEAGVVNGNDYIETVREIASKEGARVVPVCAKIEMELVELPEEDRTQFLHELGLKEPGLNALVREAYDLLGLQTYFTAGPKEVRAWTVRKGAKAPEAAAVIHTDFEKGFIRAEVMRFNDFIRLQSEAAVRDAGLLRSEGREYLVQDGDIMHFRFNV